MCIQTGEQRFYEGPIAFRFPLLFSGIAEVREWWNEATDRFRIEVEVSMRFFGYRGSFIVAERACSPEEIPLDVRPLLEEARGRSARKP